MVSRPPRWNGNTSGSVCRTITTSRDAVVWHRRTVRRLPTLIDTGLPGGHRRVGSHSLDSTSLTGGEPDNRDTSIRPCDVAGAGRPHHGIRVAADIGDNSGPGRRPTLPSVSAASPMARAWAAAVRGVQRSPCPPDDLTQTGQHPGGSAPRTMSSHHTSGIPAQPLRISRTNYRLHPPGMVYWASGASRRRWDR